MNILHLADIHKRNYQRHEEYEYVLNELCNTIEKIQTTAAKEDKIDRILIAGDLFDSKTILSTESVIFVSKLIQRLMQYVDVDIIDGNHDTNLTNKNRASALESVEFFLKDEPRFHYYKESGIYPIGNNHYYGLFSIFDDEKNYPIHIKNRKEGEVYIALYHGTLQGCSTEDGFKIESSMNPSILFAEYDYAFLGDIHKRSFLDEVEIIKEIDESEIDYYKDELGFAIIS